MKTTKTILSLLIAILSATMLIGCAGPGADRAADVNTRNFEIKAEKPPLAEKSSVIAKGTIGEAEDEVDIADEDDFNELNDDGTMQWLSYQMSVEISETENTIQDIIPDGRFVHVILTYISDDDGLGGFLFEDLRDTPNFVLIDASGNVYEHLRVIGPISIDLKDGTFEVSEIQDITGVYFDIPLDIQIDELTFSVMG